MEVNRAFLNELVHKHHSLRTRHARLIEKGEKAVGQVAKTLEIGGSAFAFGVVDGRTGGVELFGIPLPLLAGVAFHGAAFGFVSEKNAHHFHNLGDGAIASFASAAGRGIGANWKATGKLLGHGGAVRGLASGGSSSVDDAELSRLAAAL